MVNEHLQRIALSTATIAALLTEMSVSQLSRVFGTYHLEIMEAMIKSDDGFRSKVLLRKLNQAITRILDRKSRRVSR